MTPARSRARAALTALALALTGAASAQDSTAVTYHPAGPLASTSVHVSDRLYPYGFALDFCYGNVDGIQDNSGCLQNALNALGVEFGSLEIQPPQLVLMGSDGERQHSYI